MGIFTITASALLASSAVCPPDAQVAAPVQYVPTRPQSVTVQDTPQDTVPPPASAPQAEPTPPVSGGNPPAPQARATPVDDAPVVTDLQVPEPVLPYTQFSKPGGAIDADTAATLLGNAPVEADDAIVVTARRGPPPGDPVEAINEISFVAVQAVDQNVVAPVARGYKKGIPEPIRDGVHNVLNNLDEPIVFVNFLLQFKIGKAFETVGRFAINSTIGVAGLFDVARKKPFHLPRRSNGLADTLGYYGVGPGPYLFLPLIGSTSVRDLLGRVVDLSILPTALAKPFAQPLVTLTKGTLSSLDDRVENDEIITRVQQSDNPYAAMREYYLTKRQVEIDVLKGKRCNADIDLDQLQLLSEKTVPQIPPPAQVEAH